MDIHSVLYCILFSLSNVIQCALRNRFLKCWRMKKKNTNDFFCTMFAHQLYVYSNMNGMERFEQLCILFCEQKKNIHPWVWMRNWFIKMLRQRMEQVECICTVCFISYENFNVVKIQCRCSELYDIYDVCRCAVSLLATEQLLTCRLNVIKSMMKLHIFFYSFRLGMHFSKLR